MEIDIVIVAIMGIDDCAFSSSALASSRSFLLSASLLQRTTVVTDAADQHGARNQQRTVGGFGAPQCYVLTFERLITSGESSVHSSEGIEKTKASESPSFALILHLQATPLNGCEEPSIK
jgi:hypothetical protein